MLKRKPRVPVFLTGPPRIILGVAGVINSPRNLEDLLRSLERIQEVSLLAFLSIELIITGFLIVIVGPPLINALTNGVKPPTLSFLRASVEKYIGISFLGLILIFAGVIIFTRAVSEGLIHGVDGLGDWSPEFNSSARLLHLLRIGVVVSFVGLLAIIVGISNPLLSAAALLITGVVMLNPRLNGSRREYYSKYKPTPYCARVFTGSTLIMLGVLTYISTHSIFTGAIAILLGGFLLLLSSIGLATLLIGLDKAFKSPALWVASVISITVVFLPITFLMMYIEIPELARKIEAGLVPVV
ncbi:MAG: hypothetical protein QXF49_04600 [Thermosphaera sp.]